MAYKKGKDRRERIIFPDCIDEYVDAEAPVRLFDAFVDRLDIDKLGFIRSTLKETGTPGCNPETCLNCTSMGIFIRFVPHAS